MRPARRGKNRRQKSKAPRTVAVPRTAPIPPNPAVPRLGALVRFAAVVPAPAAAAGRCLEAPRRHLQSVPRPAPAAAAPADLEAPAADPAPRAPRQPSAREKMIRSDYLDYILYLEETAEFTCNGVFFNRAGQLAYDAGRIRGQDMFTRPWHQIRKYASEELIEFFDEFGRMSWTEYRAQFNNERAQAS